MIAVLQRVKKASVSIDGKTVGECAKGLMILLGVADGDDKIDAELLAAKISKLRIFEDENGKSNLSVKDIDGEMLVVSNFTLLANYKKGNRPDFLSAAAPDVANELYEYFKSLVASEVKHVGCGIFGADMEVTIVNDGPVTIVMDSKILNKNKG
jgi:D-tyrosyl-tRNA(Tyr) deacylase